MPRMIPCDYKGAPIEGEKWINIPDPSPFPHETRYYTGRDAIQRRLEAALKIKRAGYEYALFEYSDGLVKMLPIYKLEG